MKKSAGLLLYRKANNSTEVLLVHPGGPFWAKKDFGTWSIPKGEYDEKENPRQGAIREFTEELGLPAPATSWRELGTVKYSNKEVIAWTGEHDLDISQFKSNHFEMEWPPKSGKKTTFPEVDQARWFNLGEAHEKIIPGQKAFLDNLIKITAEN